MTPAIDWCGWPLITRPITSPIWPPLWRLRIFVEIRRRQGEPSKGHRLQLETDLIGLSGRSPGHVLIDCILCGAAAIVRDNQEVLAVDNCDGARKRDDLQAQAATAPRNNLALLNPPCNLRAGY